MTEMANLTEITNAWSGITTAQSVKAEAKAPSKKSNRSYGELADAYAEYCKQSGYVPCGRSKKPNIAEMYQRGGFSRMECLTFFNVSSTYFNKCKDSGGVK